MKLNFMLIFSAFILIFSYGSNAKDTSLELSKVIEKRETSWRDSNFLSSWSHPILSDYISPASTSGSSVPQVAVDGNNDAVIVWQQIADGQHRIFKSEYRSGSWTHPSSISNYISPTSTSGASVPQVAMADNGDTVIVWQQIADGQHRIFKSEYRAGSWTHPSSTSNYISPTSTAGASVPQVAIADNGDAVIVWQQVADGQHRIFKSEYR